VLHITSSTTQLYGLDSVMKCVVRISKKCLKMVVMYLSPWRSLAQRLEQEMLQCDCEVITFIHPLAGLEILNDDGRCYSGTFFFFFSHPLR